MSREVGPRRGIGAGSGLATFELKLLVIPIMVKVVMRFVGVVLTMYFDDTTTEASGGREKAVELVVGATAALRDRFALLSVERRGPLRPSAGSRVGRQLCLQGTF